MTALAALNALDQAAFTALVGPVFEHSPWIAEATWAQRPFASRAELHAALVRTMEAADEAAQVALINAHPDLVGRAARAGTLTPASTQEQAGAGLGALSADEVAQFEPTTPPTAPASASRSSSARARTRRTRSSPPFPRACPTRGPRRSRPPSARSPRSPGYRLADLDRRPLSPCPPSPTTPTASRACA